MLSCGFEDAASGFAPVHGVTAGGKMKVAKKDVKAGASQMSKSLLRGRGTIHAQAVGGEALVKKHTNTLFIVEHEHRAAPEKVCRCWNRF